MAERGRRAGQRRLDNPEDFVRLEIKAALERNIRVIPVLVDGAAMPRSADLPADLPADLARLARRNAMELRHSRFHADVDHLIGVLEKIFSPPLSPRSQTGREEEVNSPPRIGEGPGEGSPRQPFEPELILIPAGEFLMGSDPEKDKDAQDDEQPQHRLYLPDYSIAKTPVTNAQFAAFIHGSGHQPPFHWSGSKPPAGKENHPVVNVSWQDVVAYCRWLAETTGKIYRLPSEAEWEKAARGPDGHIYPWGNQWDKGRCNTTSERRKRGTTPVGAYPDGASPYGLLDMAGNVWEWCATKWQKAYPYDAKEDEWTDAYLTGTHVRALRGGSWGNNRNFARCAYRYTGNPDSGNYCRGCRVAYSPI